jgi:hypothetical protein
MFSRRPRNTVHVVVDRLTLIAIVFASIGGLLIWKGYHGDLLIGGAISAAGAIGAILASPKNPQEPQKSEIVNTPANPVPVETPQI